MRILHLVHQYLPDYVGGTELYTQALARQQVAGGHQPVVFTPVEIDARWPEAVEEDGVRVYRAPAGPRSATRAFLDTFGQKGLEEAFGQVLEREKPDLVHIQHLKGLPAALVDLLPRAGTPYVVTLHDYWFVCANAQLLTNYDETVCAGPRWWLNCGRCAAARDERTGSALLAPALAPLMGLRNRRLGKVVDGAVRLIAPTTFVRQTLSDLGLPAGKITVVHHGISLPPALEPPRQRGAGELFISFIGGLAPQKGVHILVEAVNRLPAEGVRLTVYGDPAAFPEYAAGLGQLAQHPGIHFAGRLSRRELWAALAASDVVVVPSLWYETASLVIQEAFAAGVPVIASRIGALSERVQDGVDGLLVQPGDGAELSRVLLSLRDEPGQLEALRAGIRPVRTIEEHAAEIEGIYRVVLDSQSRP